MKKILLFMAFILVASFGNAQEREKPDRESIKAAQVKFFNSELQLSEKEQEIFWPEYDKFREGMEGLRGGKKGKGKPRMELMTDAEAQAYIDNYFVNEQAKLDLRKSLYKSLNGKMNVRKLAILPQTEQKFKRRLVHRAKQQRVQGKARQRKKP